ncbi:MAG: alkaline phosphatase family protein [Melioribacteraceae bacterium]|nr:alkaline phosphatase family protein [Melioribacteraceae bacterium]
MKYRAYIAVLILFLIPSIFTAQNSDKPKLVVGIIIDQMRFDNLYKYQKHYGKDGFNRLINNGSNFTYAHFNYEPTSTAPGHASIYTGTTPFFHGIIGNYFYNRKLKKSVSNLSGIEGMESPTRLLSTTMTDQLKLATSGRAKVISISFKDRGAALPAGHNPNGAYWFDGKSGDFFTSKYYMETVPNWVSDFNNKKLSDKYASKEWNLSKPVSEYITTVPDESPYETDFFNEGKKTFPHKLDKVKSEDKYYFLENTPFANQLLVDFVDAALKGEKLGKGNETDFLAISFSTPDHLGHEFGNFSFEMEDMYIKLDSQIAELLKNLDKAVGKGNYLLFLTADHAGMDSPGYMKDNRMPAGELGSKLFVDSLKTFSIRKYGVDLIENFSNKQIFLNWEIIENNNLDIRKVEDEISFFIRTRFTAITSIFTRGYLETQVPTRESINPILNGFNPTYSGDIAINWHPGFLTNFWGIGTTHGSSYNYDRHIPLIFYGWKIPKQTVNTPVYIVDIAATICNLIGIQEPNACIGIPLIAPKSR